MEFTQSTQVKILVLIVLVLVLWISYLRNEELEHRIVAKELSREVDELRSKLGFPQPYDAHNPKNKIKHREAVALHARESSYNKKWKRASKDFVSLLLSWNLPEHHRSNFHHQSPRSSFHRPLLLNQRSLQHQSSLIYHLPRGLLRRRSPPSSLLITALII